MTDIPSLRKKQIELGQLPSSTIPIPSIEKSPEEYKDDINANRNSITDGLAKIGFTYDFIRDLLGYLTNEQIYLASLYLPQIIENFNRYDKKFVSVEQAISIIKTIIKNNKTNRRSVFRSNSTQIKPTELIYSPPLLEKDKIILESAICLAKWEHNISGINNQVYPRPKELPPYYNTSIQRNKEHPLNGYSDDTIDQIRKQPYALENFTYLLSLSKLPQNRLEDTYNKTLQLRSALSNFSGDFSISQEETIKNILKENGRRMRDAQDAYINSINSAASGTVFNLDDVGNNIFSSPSGWGFKSFGQQTESNQDMPYGNWRENIADLVLERIDCFVDFFKKLDPTLQSGLRLGGKNNKKVKRKTNKKRKYKKIKTTKRRK